MNKLLVTAALCTAFWISGAAQLLPPNQAGMTMGHIHLNVRDVEASKKFWVEQIGATPVRLGTAEAVKMPGTLVVFRRQEPTGLMDGSVINHFGIKVPNLSTVLARLETAGIAFEKPRLGGEKNAAGEAMPQSFVTGPDQFRLELTEDSALPTALLGHHVHYNVPDPTKVQQWYVATLLVKPGKRAQWDAADVPGMNLTFAPVPQSRPTVVPTKSRQLDHVGFEVKDLEAFCKKLEANGVKLDSPYRNDPELGVASAFLTDPWGTSIELTEGLNKF
jgi:catechol 2,3-dioxygenase-like lactoylglutathione lyase family enzyme